VILSDKTLNERLTRLVQTATAIGAAIARRDFSADFKTIYVCPSMAPRPTATRVPINIVFPTVYVPPFLLTPFPTIPPLLGTPVATSTPGPFSVPTSVTPFSFRFTPTPSVNPFSTVLTPVR